MGGLCIIIYKDEGNALITVITVSSNSEEYIADTMQSILNQTYQNYEYIIVDNASSDKTVDIIKSYESAFKGRLKWVSEPDKGIYDAMNKGIDLASGELIGIINSDDYYPEDTLELVAKAYINYVGSHGLIILTGSLCRVDVNKVPLFVLKAKTDQIEKVIDSSFTINHPSTFVAANVYNEVGRFNSAFKYAGDYDFFYRAVKHKKVNIINIDVVLAYMRAGGATDRIQNVFCRAKEEYMVRRGNLPFLKNILNSAHYYLVVLSKILIKRMISAKTIDNYYHNKDKLPLIVKKIAKIYWVC